MAEEKTEVIIDVQIDAARVAEELGTLTKRLEALKAAQANIRKEFADGKLTNAQYGAQMADVSKQIEATNRSIKSSTAILQAANTQTISSTMSLDEQRQAVNTLQKAYASLSGEEKIAADTEGGLRDQIKAATDSLKEQEAAIGDTRRNVGNYAEGMLDAFGQLQQGAGLLGSAAGMLNTMGDSGKKAAKALQGLQKVMDFVAKSGMMQAKAAQAAATAENAKTTADGAATIAQNGLNAAMAANPIGLIITALTTLLPLIQAFTDGSKEAEAAQAAFNLSLAATQRAMQSVSQEYEVAIAMAQAYGASEREIMDMRIAEARQKADLAQANADKARDAWANASRRQRKALAESMQEAQDEAKKAADALNALITQSLALDIKNEKKAQDERTKIAREGAENRRKAQIEQWQIEQEQRAILEKMAREGAKKAAAFDDNFEYQEGEEQELKQLEDFFKRKQALQNKFAVETAADVRDAELAELEALNAAKLLSVEDYEKIKAQIEDEYRQAMLQKNTEAAAQWSSAIMSTMSAINDAVSASENAQLDEYKKSNEEKKKSLDARLKADELSEEQYNDMVQQMDDETAAKEAELAAEQAKRNKAFNLMQAIIDTALAIVNAFATTPFPASIAMAALAGATGAAQIATIAMEPIPQFAGGGVVQGSSYTGDRVLARLNSGEGVLTAQGLQNTGNLLQAADNGMIGSGLDYQLLGETMAQAVAAQPAPVMDYSEFRQFQSKVATYNELAAV